MKTGKSIVELAQEIQRQADARADFVGDTRKMRVAPTDGGISLVMEGVPSLAVTPYTHKQIAEHVEIPARYYERMRAELPDLLAANVNAWFDREPATRMVRTLDGAARAFLSNRYRCIDNFELAEAVLPVLAGVPDMRVESAEITETRMYVKAVFPRIQGEVARGDVVQAGVVISNSEVGAGALNIQPLIYRLVCTNGLIRGEGIDGFKKLHLGGAQSAEDRVRRLMSDDTRRRADEVFWLTCRDVVKASTDVLLFRRGLDAMREAAAQRIEIDPVVAVDRAQRMFGLSDGERGSVLQHLIGDGDLSRYGLLNAVTRTAQDASSYDRATELEALGGRVLELPASEWRTLALAA